MIPFAFKNFYMLLKLCFFLLAFEFSLKYCPLYVHDSFFGSDIEYTLIIKLLLLL